MNNNDKFMNDLFDTIFPNGFKQEYTKTKEFVNNHRYFHKVYEESPVRIEIALPGFSKEDIEIEIIDNSFVISYKGEESVWKKNFSKKFKIGFKIDEQNIEAKMENGILAITVPEKEDDRKIRNIIIQ